MFQEDWKEVIKLLNVLLGPYYYRAIVDGKQAYLTKGTWEVANDFMAGPFVNYMIQDTLKNRILVVEGFVFAPTASKRDYMFD